MEFTINADIINTLISVASVVMALIAGLVFVTNIVVEVIKGLFPKTPTNIVAVAVSLVITVLALFVLCAVLEITVMWYYCVGAVVLGIFVGYAAMFGFDKLKDAMEKLKTTKI